MKTFYVNENLGQKTTDWCSVVMVIMIHKSYQWICNVLLLNAFSHEEKMIFHLNK